MVSRSLEANTDVLERIVDDIRKSDTVVHAGTWSGMRPHSPRDDVIACTISAREACADVICTVGGSSLTDGAKAVVLCMAKRLRTSASISDYLGTSISGDDATFDMPSDSPALVTIPTTLSGAEFTAIAGISDTSKTPPRKEAVSHRKLQPQLVIFDARITVHTPLWLFLSTGIRSVDHCVEAICSVQRNSYTTGIAATALSLLSSALLAVKRNPSDLSARTRCQMGVALASQTIRQVPFGASHAIGHVLGGTAGVPHGLCSCVMLPAVLKWNSAFDELKEALQVVSKHCAKGSNTISKEFRCDKKFQHHTSPPSASDVLAKLIHSLGLPQTLGSVGVKDNKLELIAKYTMYDPWTKTNPRKIESASHVLEILRLSQVRSDEWMSPSCAASDNDIGISKL